MPKIQKTPIDNWVVDPVRDFIGNSTMSGVVLFIAALLAMVISNTAWEEGFHQFWNTEISLTIEDLVIDKSLHHWINDGLVAIFFFVIGLELKREILAGELRQLQNAILPITAAIGGMIVPACVYLLLNSTGTPQSGWGIPVATDIAFALGVLYLLGDRVPVSLKVFITTMAIVDDLGAVLIIAIFYTSDISVTHLLIGGGFLLFIIMANQLGVRSTMFYALFGIGGLWLTFLLSGIHPTIAAVLLAFTIPADTKVSKPAFEQGLSQMLDRLRGVKTIDAPVVSEEQVDVAIDIRQLSKMAITPLQRLEHALHPFVSFIVMPLFALSNAGISFKEFELEQLLGPVTLGVFLGLIFGKLIGVVATVWLVEKVGWGKLAAGLNKYHLIGTGFLAAIGFTMSLFVSGLAFQSELLHDQAKLGIFGASLLASIAGYLTIKKACKVQQLKITAPQNGE